MREQRPFKSSMSQGQLLILLLQLQGLKEEASTLQVVEAIVRVAQEEAMRDIGAATKVVVEEVVTAVVTIHPNLEEATEAVMHQQSSSTHQQINEN